MSGMKLELTPLSIFLGILIGIVMTAANVYLGLYNSHFPASVNLY